MPPVGGLRSWMQQNYERVGKWAREASGFYEDMVVTMNFLL